jgi:hypothetical protein
VLNRKILNRLPILLAAAMLPSLNFHPDGVQEYSLEGAAHGPDGRELPTTLGTRLDLPKKGDEVIKSRFLVVATARDDVS